MPRASCGFLWSIYRCHDSKAFVESRIHGAIDDLRWIISRAIHDLRHKDDTLQDSIYCGHGRMVQQALRFFSFFSSTARSSSQRRRSEPFHFVPRPGFTHTGLLSCKDHLSMDTDSLHGHEMGPSGALASAPKSNIWCVSSNLKISVQDCWS